MTPETKGEPMRYEIRTVEDFCAVPIERLDVCLEEFRTCLALALTARLVAPQTKLDRFTWVDDGEKNINANVTVQSKPVAEPHP